MENYNYLGNTCVKLKSKKSSILCFSACLLITEKNILIRVCPVICISPSGCIRNKSDVISAVSLEQTEDSDTWLTEFVIFARNTSGQRSFAQFNFEQ